METAVTRAEDFEAEKYIAALWATEETTNLTKEQLERIKVNKTAAIERRKRKKEEEKGDEQQIQKAETISEGLTDREAKQ